MEKIIKSIISNDASKDNVEKLIKYYETLKKESNNFDDLVGDEKIKLNYKTEKIFYDFLFAFNDVFLYMNTNKFEEEINQSNHSKESIFFKIVLEYFEYNQFVKNQTNFLRILEIDEFEDLVEHTFNNYILFNGIINNYKKWNTNEINVVRKFINTILSYMIDQFDNTTVAFLETKIKFDFTERQFDFVWNLCEKNKKYLMLKNITEKLDK